MTDRKPYQSLQDSIAIIGRVIGVLVPNPAMSARVVARYAGCSAGEAHDVLATLVEMGSVEDELYATGDGLYSIGYRLPYGRSIPSAWSTLKKMAKAVPDATLLATDWDVQKLVDSFVRPTGKGGAA